MEGEMRIVIRIGRVELCVDDGDRKSFWYRGCLLVEAWGLCGLAKEVGKVSIGGHFYVAYGSLLCSPWKWKLNYLSCLLL